jgi:hypothetical protein
MMSVMAIFQQLTLNYSPAHVPDDGFVRQNLFAQPRRAPSVCRKRNDERMSDLLLVPGPVKDYFGPDGMLCGS